MILLSKSRTFGEYFSDTFEFIKQNGKHFFSNYFKLVTIPLVLLSGLLYFVLDGYFNGIFSALENNSVRISSSLMSMRNIGLFLVFVVIAALFQIFVYAFTPIYMMLYKEYGTRFTTSDIIATYKSRIRKIIIFSLGMIPTMLMLLIPILVVVVLLAVTIVGILAIPLVIGFVMLSLNNAFIEYISTDADFVGSITFGFSLTRTKFWPNVGAASLFYFVVSTIINIIVAVPYYIYMFVSMTTGLSENPQEMTGFYKATVLFYIASFVSSLLTMSLIQQNLGIIYYSCIEDNNSDTKFAEIDSIGNNESY